VIPIITSAKLTHKTTSRRQRGTCKTHARR